jgi:hypothetical protein
MKNGLKGVTDAMVFCKSMQKGGPAPMIKSMKNYSEGGMTSDDAKCQGWPPRKGCHGFNRKAVSGSVRRAQKRPRRF